jgi:5-methylcytosine-specific restriction endonuclease McrA
MICCKCKTEKPDTEFAIDRTNRNGRSYTCKACKNEYKKEWNKRPDVIIKQREHHNKWAEKIKQKNAPRTSEIKRLDYILSELSKRIDRFDKIIQSNIQSVIDGMYDYYNTPVLYKQCRICGKIKDVDCFETRDGSIDVYRTECRDCRKPIHLANKLRQKNNPQYLKYWKEYNKSPRRMADRKVRALVRRERAHAVGEQRMGKDDILFIYNQFNNKCFNCGSDINLNVDHHYPLSKGYALSKENAVLLCNKCNLSKHNKYPEEYYSFLKLMELAIIYGKVY